MELSSLTYSELMELIAEDYTNMSKYQREDFEELSSIECLTDNIGELPATAAMTSFLYASYRDGWQTELSDLICIELRTRIHKNPVS